MFTDVNGNRLSELENKPNRTPKEEAVLKALVELKAKSVVFDSTNRLNLTATPVNQNNLGNQGTTVDQNATNQKDFDAASEVYHKAEEANGTPAA